MFVVEFDQSCGASGMTRTRPRRTTGGPLCHRALLTFILIIFDSVELRADFERELCFSLLLLVCLQIDFWWPRAATFGPFIADGAAKQVLARLSGAPELSLAAGAGPGSRSEQVAIGRL